MALIFQDVKVLYMAGCADEGIGHLGVTKVGEHFLHKPVSVCALTGKVWAVLDW